jgi:hypothetical protein
MAARSPATRISWSSATELALPLLLVTVGCAYQPDVDALSAKLVGECGVSFGEPDCILSLPEAERVESARRAFVIGAEHAVENESQERCLLDSPCAMVHLCLDPEDRQNQDHIYGACIGFCYSRLRPCGENDCSQDAIDACMSEYLDCQDACEEDPYYTPES